MQTRQSVSPCAGYGPFKAAVFVDRAVVAAGVTLAVGVALGLACSSTQRSRCGHEVASTAPSNTHALDNDALRFEPSAVAFVDGGRTLVLGNRIETLVVDIATGSVLHRGLPATVLAPSPDGSLLLAADNSTAPILDEDQKLVRQLSLRDPHTGAELHAVTVPYMLSSTIRWVDATMVALNWAPGDIAPELGDALVPVAALWGERLAATSPRSTQDVLAGYQLPQEPSPPSKCSYNPAYPDVCPPTRRAVPCAIARSPSQKRLVMRLCSGGRTPLRFDDVGQPAQPLQLPDGEWHTFAFLDDQRIVAARNDGPVVIYDLQRNAIEATLPSRAHTEVTVAPDGHTMVTWSGWTGVQLWDVTAGHAPRELLPQPGHRSEIKALAFAPNGATLASGGSDGTVRQWDVATGAQRTVIDVASSIAGLALADDGRVALNAYQKVELWSFATKQRIAHTAPVGGSNTNVHIAFAADGETIEYQDRDMRGTTRWQPTTQISTPDSADEVPAWRRLSSSWTTIERNHRVAMLSDSDVTVHDASSGRTIGVVRSPDITSLALSNDGSVVAVATRGGRVMWRNLAAPDAALQKLALPSGTDDITALAIAPDNRSIACGDAAGRLLFVRL